MRQWHLLLCKHGPGTAPDRQPWPATDLPEYQSTRILEYAPLNAEIQWAVADTGQTAENLGTEIATAVTDLKEASDVRQKELNDLGASEELVVGVIDILQRTVEILDRKMAKNPALPRKKIDHMNINNVVSAFSAVVDAASLFSSDTKKHVLLTE